MTRSRIQGSAECVDSRFVGSLNATIDAWYAWAGVWAVILAPYGGDRTATEQRIISPGQTFSDHLLTSAALARAAADIDNWRAIILAGAKRHGLTYEQAKAHYYAIAEAHGWKNQQTNGRPFPAEGWHLAKHTFDTAASGGSAIPMVKDTDMPKMFHSDAPRRIVLIAGDSSLALGQATANALVPLYGRSTLVPAASLKRAEQIAALMGKANAEAAADAITTEGLALVAAPTT